MSDLEKVLHKFVESFEHRLNEALQEQKVTGANEKVANASSTGKVEPANYDDEFFSKAADDYIQFTYENPTIYHVVNHFSEVLEAKGFTYVSEKEKWNIEPGKYYTTRNGTALIAFVVGKNWDPSKGVGAIGSHIDSLTAALKPNSSKSPVDGYDLLGVAPYAGTLGNVWFDRDLGIGGRLLVRDGSTKEVTQKLVDLTPQPIAKIPSLAPHFGEPSKGPFNTETQAVPVIGYGGAERAAEPTESEKSAPLYGKHPLQLLRYIAKKAKVDVADILQWDLQLYDVQRGTKGGLDSEFVFAPRIDDRICSYAAIQALIGAAEAGQIPEDNFSVVGLFDNEEIGSGTRQGIRGGLFETVVSRVVSGIQDDETSVNDLLSVTYANSIILSADVNHLVNPNFDNIYLEHHKPVPNKGVVIALDPNGHMATDSIGLALVEELAKKNGDEIQYFQIRNDSRSGGTIGPFISMQTGARTIDLGIPQLSMHSIRATVGAKDIGNGIKFFQGFFSNWRKSYDKYIDL
jgi:aminopeptidase I